MKIELLKTARRLWSYELCPPELNRINQLKWARAVHELGDKWLLAQQVHKNIK